jgi:hypothetical protein
MIVFPTFAQLLLKLQPAKNRKPKPSKSFADTAAIGILIHYHDFVRKEAIADFFDNLNRLNKNISVLYYCDAKITPPSYPQGLVLTDKDVAWYGAIRKKAALKFMRTAFDYLYVVAPKPEMITRFLIGRSKASTVIGQSHDLLDDYQDMIINIQPKDMTGEALLKHMFHYTTQLK